MIVKCVIYHELVEYYELVRLQFLRENMMLLKTLSLFAGHYFLFDSVSLTIFSLINTRSVVMSKSDILNIVGDVYVVHVSLNNFADPTCVPGITIPLK